MSVVGDNIVVKTPGPGLAVGVLADATVVRLLVVPAVTTPPGRHAWWTPRWLDRVLPHLDAEGGGAPERTEPERPAAAGEGESGGRPGGGVPTV